MLDVANSKLPSSLPNPLPPQVTTRGKEAIRIPAIGNNGTQIGTGIPQAQSNRPQSLSTANENSDTDPAEAQLHAESSHHTLDATTVPVPEPETDPYDGYDTDPPAHYPKAGNGLARTMRPESEDLQWLVDDNFEVFSHNWKGDGETVGSTGAGQGLNGFDSTDTAIGLGVETGVSNTGS